MLVGETNTPSGGEKDGGPDIVGAFNFFQRACGLFGRPGRTFYRNVIDNGKAVAPIATPLVQGVLAAKGLPITGAGAVQWLAGQAIQSGHYPPLAVDALAQYVLAHLPPGPLSETPTASSEAPIPSSETPAP